MTEGRDRRPVRRTVVITAILLVVAAVLLVAVRHGLDGTADESGGNRYAVVAADPAPISRMPEPAPIVAVETSAGAATVPAVVPASAETLKVVLLPVHPAYAEPLYPHSPATADAVRQATLRALHTMTGVEVWDVDASATRYYLADIVAEFSARPMFFELPPWLVSMQLRRPEGTSTSDGTFYTANGEFWSVGSDSADRLGIRYAETIVRLGARTHGQVRELR